MKNQKIILLAFLFINFNLLAQQDTVVTFGNQTNFTTVGGKTALQYLSQFPSVFSAEERYSNRQQYLFSGDSILGTQCGAIILDSVSFFIKDLRDSILDTFQISYTTVPESDDHIGAFFFDNLLPGRVHINQNLVKGWNTFTVSSITTPWRMIGSQNLIIQICNSGPGKTQNTVAFHDAGKNVAQGYNSDSPSICENPSIGFIPRTKRPDVRLHYRFKECPTNVNQYDEFEGLKIYPNPVQKVLNISVTDNGMISMRDALGREVLQQSVLNGSNEIDISEFNAGIYFLQISNGRNTKTVRVIKKK